MFQCRTKGVRGEKLSLSSENGRLDGTVMYEAFQTMWYARISHSNSSLALSLDSS